MFSVTTIVYKNYGYENIQELQNVRVQTATALSFVVQKCRLDNTAVSVRHATKWWREILE